LVVVDELNDNLYLSLRNMEKVQSCALTDLNTYDIVNADALVLTEGAAKIFTDEAQQVEA
jgi:large subunit ribosomal protein L4